jgi:hypothetical protein
MNDPNTNQPQNLPWNYKRNPEIIAKVAELVGSGTPIKHAAEACGIDRNTIYAWMESDPTLSAEIKRRRSQALHERVERIRAAGQKGIWTADAWYLERQHPEEFGLKQDKPAINIQVVVRDCTVDAPKVIACDQNTVQLVGTIVHNQGCDADDSVDK